jgi:hypothetical protein
MSRVIVKAFELLTAGLVNYYLISIIVHIEYMILRHIYLSIPNIGLTCLI